MTYLETYDYNRQIINIARSTGHKRTDNQLKILKEWIEKNSKQNSIVNTFLNNCTMEEGMEFCRGLKYRTFKPNKLLIRQGETGDAYFIVLSGECNIYVNKYLVKGDIANEKRSGGLGKLVDTVSVGRDFGEYSLISSQPRAASIQSEVFTECLVCYQQHFQKCLEKHAQNRVVDVIKEAQQFPIFKGVSLAYLKQIFNRFNRIQVPSNTILQTNNRKIESILLIAKGKYREYLEVKDHNTNKIRKKFISESMDGKGMVGSYYAITNKRPKTNIMTITPCECLAISKKHFLNSITFDMEQNIRSVGKEKDKLIKQHLYQFKKTVKYLYTHHRQSALSELKFQEIYSRHGKWGKFEHHLSDNLINKLNLSEPIRKSIIDTYNRISEQENDWKQLANIDNINDTQHHKIDNKIDNWIHVPSIRNKPPKTSQKRYRTTFKTRPKTSAGVGYSLKDITALKAKYNNNNINNNNNNNNNIYDLIQAKNEMHEIQTKIKKYHSNASTLLKSHSNSNFKHLMLSQFKDEYDKHLYDVQQQQIQYDTLKKFKVKSPNQEIKTMKKILNNHRLQFIQRSLNKNHSIQQQKSKTMKVKKMRQCYTEKKVRYKHSKTQRKCNQANYISIRTKKL